MEESNGGRGGRRQNVNFIMFKCSSLYSQWDLSHLFVEYESTRFYS